LGPQHVSTVDEVHGFRYIDDRDLLGFVDGTDNPRGEAVIDAALIGNAVTVMPCRPLGCLAYQQSRLFTQRDV
jgi:deferrochelatase/peroxidase EfeB